MSTEWSLQQVLALAPDPGSAKSGQELATPRKWQILGRSDQALWGECQGSGKLPYQTQIDLSEPAFKCTCPSRKFPCKHGIGLLLLLAKEPAAITASEPPAWVTQWLASRTERAAKKEEKTSEAKAAPDPAAQAKRQAQRENRVTAGLTELRLFLNDLVRQGLADLPSRPGRVWEGMAARMEDLQAPGIARILRETASAASTGAGWQDRVLSHISKLHLAIEGWEHRADLTPDELADLRTAIGWSVPQEEILATAGVRDAWAIVGQSVEEEDRLRSQRTWLIGTQSGRQALVIAFAHGSASLDTSLVPGTQLEAELAFFPSAVPLRAVVKERIGQTRRLDSIPATCSATQSRAVWSKSLAACPWMERSGMSLKGILPIRKGTGWIVRDQVGRAVPIAAGFERGWHLMALSGGCPIDLFGEWNGDRLRPLGVFREGRFTAL